jgi:hypothetical protein
MVSYSPLDPQVPEIRVLKLLRGKGDSPIQCELKTVSLRKPPAFNALSYVWGNAAITKPIIVDGSPFEATVNLEAALRAIRSPLRSQLIWADAVCINQKDVEEKNTQIPLMSDIYSTAADVVVWLGPSNPNIKLAVSWAREWKSSILPASLSWAKVNLAADFSAKGREARKIAYLRTYEGFLDIFSMPYWTRMWTYQEYYLAKRDPICLCGEIEFRATLLAEFLDDIHYVLWNQIEDLYNDTAKGTTAAGEQDEFINQFAKFKDTLAEKNARAPHIRRSLEPSPRPVARLLSATAGLNHYDPHDRFYGVYGMVPNWAKAYPADYKKPVEQVVIETTVYMIHHEEGLKMYFTFPLLDDRLSGSRYPSWVPNFNAQDKQSPNMHVPGHSVLDSSLSVYHEAPPARVSEDMTTLSLSARNLGACEVVFHFDEQRPGVLKQICGLLKTNPASLPEDSPLKRIRDQGTLTHRVAWACVVFDKQNESFTTEEVLESFDELAANYLESESVPFEKAFYALDACSKSVKWLMGKTLFVTEGGFFGIGVRDIADGDILTVGPQANAPLVLRRVDDDHHKMVGTAYVDGLMAPKSLDKSLVREVREKDLESFLIL